MIKHQNLLIIISLLLFLDCKTSKGTGWKNPIKSNINPYGVKDVFVFLDKQNYYLLGTEYKNPYKRETGPILYISKNLKDWKSINQPIKINEIDINAWYKNGWFAPEIKKIKNKYYLTFNSRNNNENPYQKTGFGIAVSDSLLGNYQIINTNAPLVNSNHGSLTIVNEDEIYLTYDMDGRIFIVEINLETATLKNEPLELLGPKTLKENFKYLDAPQITKINDTYHILFSQFYGGYIINVYHMTAKHPKGPWIWSENNPVYTFLEADADLEVKNTYPEKHDFAPPTQVVFSNQIFKGLNNQYFNAYHSSEKYSEPYLCIDSVLIDGDKIIIKQNKKSYE